MHAVRTAEDLVLRVWVEGNGRVRFGDWFGISFQRTLRVRDGAGISALPAGLGASPVFPVKDYATALPTDWVERGGVFVALHNGEAMWIGLQGESWRPHAVKVGVGAVNAVTGERWDPALRDGPQDYLVCPPQMWLDGVKTAAGVVRQFVAVPHGAGRTVEAQVSGEERIGGIQIVVFEPRAGRFPDRPPEQHDTMRDPEPEASDVFGPPAAVAAALDPMVMGAAAGGQIEQRTYRDPYGADTWDRESFGAAWVYLLDAARLHDVTGRLPHGPPIDEATYVAEELPWFRLSHPEQGDLPPDERLSRLRSLDGVRKSDGTER